MDEILREDVGSQVTLQAIFKELKKRLLLVVAIIFFCTAVGGVFGAFVVDTTYTSSATMMVKVGEGGLSEAQSLASALKSITDPQNEQLYKKTMIKFNSSYPQNQVTLKEMKGIITTSSNNMLFNISIETTNPMATSILNVFMTEVQTFTESQPNLFVNKVEVVSPPSELESDGDTKVFKYLALFFILGAFCSMCLVFVRVMLDDTYSDKASFEREFTVDVLATFEDVSHLNKKNAKAKAEADSKSNQGEV